MSDLFQWLLDVVHWAIGIVLVVLEDLGLRGGVLHRFVGWLDGDAAAWLAAALATIVLAAFTILTAGLAGMVDRRVLARVQGRKGPRYSGPWGSLQGVADWFKMMLKVRPVPPSAAAAALSGALAIGALALMPLGPWAKLADPDWGVIAASTLLALSPLPLAWMSPAGRRHAAMAEATASGVLLVLAVSSVLLVTGVASARGVVEAQEEWAWGTVISPLGLLLFMVVMHWCSMDLARTRRTSPGREGRPGPHRAIALYATAARYYGLGILGALVFLGGWWGPVHQGGWWTLLKAYALIAVASLFASALPSARPGETPRAVRNHWLPLAALNLVVVAAIMEVMA